ncbi:hypothetical protein A5634_15050 [Mycobacterium asiaticum]|uniref:PE domain-containing protein n=1 Tax=Mycobacterium asiaticum TaxID=1790 RepID=A0A1A3PAZ6_MYCAS|nr:hypothetical protein A5634_15050 [Mycobacterium asiaticum]
MIATPDLVAVAASDLHGIGESLRAAAAAAAPSTTGIALLAGDEVSAAVTRLFGSFGQEYQALSAQATLFHDQFLTALNAGGKAYASAEAAGTCRCRTSSKPCWG